MKKILFLLTLVLLSGLSFATSFYPADGATEAPYDCTLKVTLDEDFTPDKDFTVTIADESGNIIDTIKRFDEVQTFADGTQINVGPQLILGSGKEFIIQPHYGIIKPSSKYSVTFNDKVFSFTTKAGPQVKDTVTVSNSSRADFASIQGALDFISGLEGTYTIKVAPGSYYELLRYTGTANVIIQGDTSDYGQATQISYINCNDMNGSQSTRVSFYFTGANLILENLTFTNLADGQKAYITTNPYPSGNAQAETLFFAKGDGHTLTAYNCSFKGHQDTMQISGKCWFYHCYVEGDVDFIWGTADVALFESCYLRCLRYVKDRAYIFETRVGSQENPIVPKGFVLYNSIVTVDKNQLAFYGRRATAKEKAKSPYYDNAAIINTHFTGEGNVHSQKWYVGKEPVFFGDSSNVGWKEYNVSFDHLVGNPNGRWKDSADISPKVYKKEYSNRDQIMNRVFNTDTGKYQADKEKYWDLNATAKERGYPVPKK
jgi:pectin methylesterase-like acyl-CoA thioesterase